MRSKGCIDDFVAWIIVIVGQTWFQGGLTERACERFDAGRRAEEEHASVSLSTRKGVWHAPGDDRGGARAELESLGAGLHDV